MKPKEKALSEWVSDEIAFDDSHLSGKTVFTRDEFTNACKMMRGRSGASVPALHESMEQIKQALRTFGNLSPDSVEQWLDSFFAPENMLRFIDPYEIKKVLIQRAKNLRARATGTLFETMR